MGYKFLTPVKHDSLRKLKRNLEILELRRRNPDMTLAVIGARYHITRARVLQILRAMERRGKLI